MKMSPDQNDRSKWLRELNINVTIDRFSQAADTSGNSVIKCKPPNQVTQIRNTTGVLFLTLPEQKESLRQKFLSLFKKKARTSTFREISLLDLLRRSMHNKANKSCTGLRIGLSLLFVSLKCITHYKTNTKLMVLSFKAKLSRLVGGSRDLNFPQLTTT